MRSLFASMVLAFIFILFAMVGLVACTSTGSNAVSTVTNIVETYLPVVVSAGLPVAQGYVASMVADGKISQMEADAINSGLSAAVAKLSATSPAPALTPATSSETAAAKAIHIIPDTVIVVQQRGITPELRDLAVKAALDKLKH